MPNSKRKTEEVSLSFKHLGLDGGSYTYPSKRVKPPKRISKLLKTKEYIHTAAQGGVSERMYAVLEDTNDIFLSHKVSVPLLRISAAAHTNGDLEMLSVIENTNIPERYKQVGWEEMTKRMKVGRQGEVIVATILTLAKVDAVLLPMVIDGDTSNPTPDILLIPPNKTLAPTAWDVKAHSNLHFTNSPSSFPDELRVDFSHAMKRKAKWCEKNGYSFKGTLHFSIPGGGVLVVLNSSSDLWEERRNTWDGKERVDFVAPIDVMYPLSKLVKKYTHGKPEYRTAKNYSV